MWAGFRKNSKHDSIPPELAVSGSHHYTSGRKEKTECFLKMGRVALWLWSQEREATIPRKREGKSWGNKYSFFPTSLWSASGCYQLHPTSIWRARLLLIRSLESSELPSTETRVARVEMDLKKHKEGMEHKTSRWFAEACLQTPFPDLYHHALSISSSCLLLIFSYHHSRQAIARFLSCDR